MNEEWKPIPTLPEYEASSLGRLRRVPHFKPMPKGGERRYGGAPTFGAWDEVTNRFVVMYRGKTYRVGRLVCEAFHGPAPFPRAVAMHGDEDSRNNRPDNLSWGTQKQNLNAPGYLEYARTARAAKKHHHRAKKRAAA